MAGGEETGKEERRGISERERKKIGRGRKVGLRNTKGLKINAQRRKGRNKSIKKTERKKMYLV